MKFEEGPNSYTSPEGMWNCNNCDADFCLVHGKEHVEITSLWLKPYHKPKNTAKAQVKSKLDVMKEQWVDLQNQNIINV